ncbi:MAG: hypothetical protein WC333_02395 [Dehalococcoidia bacterium]
MKQLLFTTPETVGFIEKYLLTNKAIPYKNDPLDVKRHWDEMKKDYSNPDVDREYICAYIRDRFYYNGNYKDYTNKTLYWRYVSDYIRMIAGHRCEFFKDDKDHANTPMQAHHTTYDAFGWEILRTKDLLCLCRTCHDTLHQQYHYLKEFKANLNHERLRIAVLKKENDAKCKKYNEQIDAYIVETEPVWKGKNQKPVPVKEKQKPEPIKLKQKPVQIEKPKVVRRKKIVKKNLQPKNPITQSKQTKPEKPKKKRSSRHAYIPAWILNRRRKSA